MRAESKLSSASTLNKEELLEKYLKEFRVDQCPLFLQHKCQQHRPFTCFHWHFQNQRRRRPIRRRDGTFNYSADVYCSKYDETTGLCPDGDECPYLHRTAGDTERRYHLKYYKTGMCVHDTDNRGFCVKNGPHCAFAHGANDLRPAVYDIRELQAIENGETDPVMGPNSLDKERSLLNDDPKWLDTTYVLANYKTEPCKKPPRLCRQGYACPQFHNNKDRRRSPRKYKYRSTPCPAVKTADEWGDPANCDTGDNCQYCHTRTEQQFHPEIYKSTKCNDIQNTSYCPRGAFCAFAHQEQESLENGPEGGPNFAEILNKALPDSTDHSFCDSGSEQSSNSGELNEFTWGEGSRAPGSQLNPMKNQPTTPPTSLLDHSGHCSIPTSPTYHKMRTSSGDSCRMRNQILGMGGALDDMSINDLYEGSKSRNCSGNSISQGLVSSGFLSSSNPVNIPGSGELTDGFGLLSNMHGAGEHHGDGGYMTGLGSNLGFSSGLFDFGPSHPAQATSNVKDVEICRLREELGAARAKLHSWEESMGQARTACDAWKKEAAMANKKAEMAIKEREVALNKAVQLQKELEQLSGGPLLHALRRIADLPNLPPAVLKTLDWTLRKDIQESEQHLWMSNNRLLENVQLNPNTQQQNINEWALGLNMQPLYSQLTQPQ